MGGYPHGVPPGKASRAAGGGDRVMVGYAGHLFPHAVGEVRRTGCVIVIHINVRT